MRTQSVLLAALLLGGGCYTGLHAAATRGEDEDDDDGEDGEAGDAGGGSEDGSTGVPACDPEDPGDNGVEVNDFADPSRVLRRITLTLAGRFPYPDEYEELASLTADEQDDWLENKADELMEEPEFYEQMLDLGRKWIRMPLIPNYADVPEYSGHQAALILPCAEGTAMAGAWATHAAHCDGLDFDGNPVAVRTVEPWWAEGTQIEAIADAGKPDAFITAGGVEVDCGRSGAQGSSNNPGCGCGPNLAYCYPADSTGAYGIFVPTNPEGSRRLLWEEPARLFAHIVWHDRPLDDLIVGDYSVGPTRVRAAYVRWGRKTGAVELDGDETWWRASNWSSPVDPRHDATDPTAWSEFEVSTLQPYLLSDRNVQFDPRVDPREALAGIPSAGVLTMLGMLGGYPRERVRAARMLETFACESFAPPPGDIEFSPYHIDAATTGTCQHCHVRIDPAAIHFKRVQRSGVIGGSYQILGVGNWQLPPEWVSNAWPWTGLPWPRLTRSFLADTKMTPASAEAIAEDSYRMFIDFLPEDQTLLGTTGDGTIGPLGFGKILESSGAFDRCAVRRIHERIVGRDIDPTTESGYLTSLVEAFVNGDRMVKPFIATLIAGESFHRGI